MRDKNNLIKETQNDTYITLTYFHIHCLFLSANYYFRNRKKGGVFQTALLTIYYRLHFFLQIGFYIYQLFMRYFPRKLVSSYSYPFGFSFVF